MTDLDKLLAGYEADLAALQAARDVLRPEWESLGKQASHIEELIRGIRRGRGELFYAHPQDWWDEVSIKECDSLYEAKCWLRAVDDGDNGTPIGIVGPGINTLEVDDGWEKL